MRNLLILSCMLLFIISCTSSKKTNVNSSKQEVNMNEVEGKNPNLDLTAQLRRLPGVVIRGEGANAKFQIRGASTLSSGNAPLFVLDGQAYNSYSDVYRLVNPNNFKSAEVLKNASETSLYGARGSNGVIVINTK